MALFVKPTWDSLRPFPYPSVFVTRKTHPYACRGVKTVAPAYVLARPGNVTRVDGIANPLTVEVILGGVTTIADQIVRSHLAKGPPRCRWR